MATTFLLVLWCLPLSLYGCRPQPEKNVTWHQHGFNEYYFNNNAASSYSEAEVFCSKHSAMLVLIQTADVQSFINSILKTFSSHDYFIGLKRVLSITGTCNFKWIDGTSECNSFTNWAPGEPNNDKVYSNCAVMVTEGKWYAKPCNIEKDFICQRQIATTSSIARTTSSYTGIVSESFAISSSIFTSTALAETSFSTDLSPNESLSGTAVVIITILVSVTGTILVVVGVLLVMKTTRNNKRKSRTSKDFPVNKNPSNCQHATEASSELHHEYEEIQDVAKETFEEHWNHTMDPHSHTYLQFGDYSNPIGEGERSRSATSSSVANISHQYVNTQHTN